MLTLETLTAFFGWCSIINAGILLLTTFAIGTCRRMVSGIHRRMFDLSETELNAAYFQYLAHYKILILVLNIVPYIVLRIISD